MKRPNFFVIGAPKCGTTSLVAWLSEHPQIYMSPVKEPHFFNTDHTYNVAKSTKAYERLFERACSNHRAIGEASVYYAYSNNAIPLIESYASEPKYILCLRNPYKMVVSLHRQQLFAGYEDVLEFSEAWRTHRNRISYGNLPAKCPDPIHIDYENTCKLGSLLEKVKKSIPEKRLKVLLLEDIAKDPLAEYIAVCDYLGLERIIPRKFSVENPAKRKINPWIHSLLRKLGRAKRAFGIERGWGFLNAIGRLNTREPLKCDISEDVRSQLVEVFNPEIDKMSILLNKDLSSWKM